MSSKNYLIVGLGNPGKKYEKNRHNVGTMIIHHLSENIFNLPFSKSSKLHGEIIKTSIDGSSVIILKPETYMNESGIAVGATKKLYNIDNENIFVIYDELDLKLGDIRIKNGGGSGGHNGIKSLDLHCGKEYWRIRVGIGRPQYKNDVTNHVLGDFTSEEEGVISKITEGISQNLNLLLIPQKHSIFIEKVKELLR